MTSGLFTVWDGTYAGNVVFATADGHARMITPDGALVWKTAIAIPGASFPLVLPTTSNIYIGATDGKLHQLSLDTGAETATQTVGDGTAAVGSPTYDRYANELYVGTTTGTIYRYTLPF